MIFKVGGTIDLRSRLKIREQSFLTIDGSTAPSPGITVRGYGIYISNSHDIIIKNVRVRNSIADGFTVRDGAYNIVIDRCSVTNSADENISITSGSRNVTVSWCIIGDTRLVSVDLEPKGMLIASFNESVVTDVFLRYNLFINESQRSPQVSTPGLFDIRNNVIRNWKAYGIRIRDGAWGNIINNVFATNNNAQRAIILVSDGKRDAGQVYIHGNLGPGMTNVNAQGTAAGAFPVRWPLTDPVEEVERKVLKRVGVFPRDEVDSLLTNSTAQK